MRHSSVSQAIDKPHTTLCHASELSAVTQNQPLKVEIKGFKASHFLEGKTPLVGLVNAGPKGHVECPESEPASLQATIYSLHNRGLVWALDRTRAWDQS
jgi:hypothetical protein